MEQTKSSGLQYTRAAGTTNLMTMRFPGRRHFSHRGETIITVFLQKSRFTTCQSILGAANNLFLPPSDFFDIPLFSLCSAVPPGKSTSQYSPRISRWAVCFKWLLSWQVVRAGILKPQMCCRRDLWCWALVIVAAKSTYTQPNKLSFNSTH